MKIIFIAMIGGKYLSPHGKQNGTQDKTLGYTTTQSFISWCTLTKEMKNISKRGRWRTSQELIPTAYVGQKRTKNSSVFFFKCSGCFLLGASEKTKHDLTIRISYLWIWRLKRCQNVAEQFIYYKAGFCMNLCRAKVSQSEYGRSQAALRFSSPKTKHSPYIIIHWDVNWGNENLSSPLSLSWHCALSFHKSRCWLDDHKTTSVIRKKFRYYAADAICLTSHKIVSESKPLMELTVAWEARTDFHMSKSVWISSRVPLTLLIVFHSNNLCLVSNSNNFTLLPVIFCADCKAANVDLKALPERNRFCTVRGPQWVRETYPEITRELFLGGSQ